MFRRIWQITMIYLARSPFAARFMQGNRTTSFLARKYVAGQSPSHAVQRARELLEGGVRSSLFYLGEYVNSQELVAENVKNKLTITTLLGKFELDVHISVDPTQIGQSLNADLAKVNAFKIAEAIRTTCAGKAGVHCLMLDMEDASVIDATISLHNELKQKEYPVALTLQAYLKRTASDMAAQVHAASRVRLVKGAFSASSNIAFTRQDDIKANFRSLVEIMFSREAREKGFYPIVATHDHRLHDFAIKIARRNGWEAGQYEFEMLLGVRSNIARELALQGERVRVYVPFGLDWWPYAVRRIGENPHNALLLARSLIQ